MQGINFILGFIKDRTLEGIYSMLKSINMRIKINH
jgi:hypothetical protein